MSRPADERGYALLAALLLVSLAAILVSAAVAAVTAGQDVAAADRAGASADAAWTDAFDQACLALRQQPSKTGLTLSSSLDSPLGVSWEVTTTAVPPQAEDAPPQVQLDVVSRAGVATRWGTAFVALRPDLRAQGCQAAGDVALLAPCTLAGTGLYSGGSVYGREWLSFIGSSGASSPAPDPVHGIVWPLAAAHAAAGIWAAGSEIHGPSGSSAYPADTDADAGGGVPAGMIAEPDAGWVASFLDAAIPPGPAFHGGVLDLAELPREASGDQPAGAAYAVAVDAGGDPVEVVGVRPDDWCPVVVLCLGRASIGRAGRETAWTGALVSLGGCRVAGETLLTGHLFAASLTVAASLVVTVPADWQARPLPGLVRPVIESVSKQ